MRTKKTIITSVTQQQANDAFAAYAKAEAQIKRITADIELKTAQIRQLHADRLANLVIQKDEAFQTLQAYATINRDTLFSKKKSLDLPHGTIGFRTGTPKLKTLRGFTWASCLQLVRRILPEYVRTSEDIDKARLLADRNVNVPVAGEGERLPMQQVLQECGITVTQDETFYVEPKEEEPHKP